MQIKRTRALLAALLAGLLFLYSASGCAAPGTAAPSADAGDTMVFTDSCGRQVELPQTITRVAPSGSSAQILLYTAAPDLLVGWSAAPSNAQKKYYDEKYWDLPVFGQFYGKNVSLNMEAIIGADPQVIIDIGDKKTNHAQDMDNIQEQTGIPTIFIEASLETYPQAYRTLGNLLNCQAQCEKIAAYIEATLAQAGANTAQLTPAEKVRVYYGTGETGLEANAKGSIHSDVLELVGAENVTVVQDVSAQGGGNTISMEQLLNFDPEVVLLAEAHCYADVSSDPLWAGVRAIQQNTYYEIPNGPFCWTGTPPSVNRVLGAKWLGNLLYPQLYDFDMVGETLEFYKLFWHYDMTQSEAQGLLANSTLKAQGQPASPAST